VDNFPEKHRKSTENVEKKPRKTAKKPGFPQSPEAELSTVLWKGISIDSVAKSRQNGKVENYSSSKTGVSF
jgi:hypothetical protein